MCGDRNEANVCLFRLKREKEGSEREKKRGRKKDSFAEKVWKGKGKETRGGRRKKTSANAIFSSFFFRTWTSWLSFGVKSGL